MPDGMVGRSDAARPSPRASRQPSVTMRAGSVRRRGERAEMVAVGAVLRAHGLRGEVLVEADSENPDRFRTGAELFAEVDGRARRLKVASNRPHRDRLLIRFVDVMDRDEAETLRGAVLEVPAAEAPPVEDGVFYYFQLVGCRVVDRRLGELGEVTDVVEDGGGVLLEVSGAAGSGGGSVLVPFANALLPKIDVGEGLITSDLPEGLVETCGSTS